jgi:hypothetical protein
LPLPHRFDIIFAPTILLTIGKGSHAQGQTINYKNIMQQ